LKNHCSGWMRVYSSVFRDLVNYYLILIYLPSNFFKAPQPPLHDFSRSSCTRLLHTS
jgi:hypothetical protein